MTYPIGSPAPYSGSLPQTVPYQQVPGASAYSGSPYAGATPSIPALPTLPIPVAGSSYSSGPVAQQPYSVTSPISTSSLPYSAPIARTVPTIGQPISIPSFGSTAASNTAYPTPNTYSNAYVSNGKIYIQPIVIYPDQLLPKQEPKLPEPPVPPVAPPPSQDYSQFMAMFMAMFQQMMALMKQKPQQPQEPIIKYVPSPAPDPIIKYVPSPAPVGTDNSDLLKKLIELLKGIKKPTPAPAPTPTPAPAPTPTPAPAPTPTPNDPLARLKALLDKLRKGDKPVLTPTPAPAPTPTPVVVTPRGDDREPIKLPANPTITDIIDLVKARAEDGPRLPRQPQLPATNPVAGAGSTMTTDKIQNLLDDIKAGAGRKPAAPSNDPAPTLQALLDKIGK